MSKGIVGYSMMTLHDYCLSLEFLYTVYYIFDVGKIENYSIHFYHDDYNYYHYYDR